MFNNIGAKIKGLAKFIFWVICIISIIGGILVVVSGIASNGNDAKTVIMSIVIGFIIAVGGTVMAWLQNFLLYGFGELVDSNQKILHELEQANIEKSIQRNVQP